MGEVILKANILIAIHKMLYPNINNLLVSRQRRQLVEFIKYIWSQMICFVLNINYHKFELISISTYLLPQRSMTIIPFTLLYVILFIESNSGENCLTEEI